ncbi:Acid-resistance membrane protein [Parendozoicomonas haliclonae]|uniref:Uncharacterized protein n=1 Tax=Parendozoicomonas haliclonae TaxID=1960125 RepID=A0A1X7ARW2_9GAMM|nr:hypothetical protein EHSB41UT_04786 [Parendozoicomonas haliclonae]
MQPSAPRKMFLLTIIIIILILSKKSRFEFVCKTIFKLPLTVIAIIFYGLISYPVTGFYGSEGHPYLIALLIAFSLINAATVIGLAKTKNPQRKAFIILIHCILIFVISIPVSVPFGFPIINIIIFALSFVIGCIFKYILHLRNVYQ